METEVPGYASLESFVRNPWGPVHTCGVPGGELLDMELRRKQFHIPNQLCEALYPCGLDDFISTITNWHCPHCTGSRFNSKPDGSTSTWGHLKQPL